MTLRPSFLLLLLFLGACSFGANRPEAPRDNELPTGGQGGERKVGNPYRIGGVWYYPKEDPNYDETGYASWYGKDFHGRLTANGETYNMNALTAAHKTLPMPSFVKVTNLENGRSIVLRVNDRGPFAKGRIIDISRRGAQLLGFEQQGVTRVRVQLSDENGRVTARPAKEKRYTERTANGQTNPILDSADFFVQIGAYSDRNTAQIQADRVNVNGRRAVVVAAKTPRGTLWRVRVGPYKSRGAAERALDQLVSDGFYEARVFNGAS